MSGDALSTMVEATVQALVSGMPARAVPAMLADRWPDAPPLELVLVLISAADGIEAMLTPRSPPYGEAQALWRVAALLAVEVHALQVSQQKVACARDLVEHWQQSGEGFFLPAR